MIGIVEHKGGRGRRPRVERRGLMGLSCLWTEIPVNERLRDKARLRRVRRGAEELVRAGVRRVLTAAEFSDWSELKGAGLRPVETETFCQMLAAPLALAALGVLGRPPERAAVLLRGASVGPALIRAAEQLCPRVRDLAVDAGAEGEELAAWLRAEFGAAVRPPETTGADVVLCFGPGEPAGRIVFRLYGPKPDLAGFFPAPQGLNLPGGLDRLPLLALLWETGRISKEGLKILPPNTKLLT